MDERIRKVLDFIETHLSEKLSLENLADLACMSSAHFHKTFKKETDRTPFKFIEELKMSRAHQLIIEGKETINDISAYLGYNDYETFSRGFKKYHSIAPDDMKAIAQHVKSVMDISPNGIILKVFEVENLEEAEKVIRDLIHELKNLLLEKGYQESDLEFAKIMPVMAKPHEPVNQNQLIKNKYLILENQRLWQNILTQSIHEPN